MVIPAVPAPNDRTIRTPIDLTLKPDWSFDTKRRIFTSEKGEKFSPFADLPPRSRIVYKTADLARAKAVTLNVHERALRRYMQLILPAGESPVRLLPAVRSWPPIEEASSGPVVSLPG